MKPLSPTLSAAIAAGVSIPAARLELLDAVPHDAPLFDGGPTGRHDATLAPDGAVAQAYLDAGGAVYARRVPDPTLSAWGMWTHITDAAPAAGVALTMFDDRMRLLWQDAATTGVYASDSVDGGANWAPAALLFDPGATLAGLAADGAGTVFVAYQTAGATWRVAVWADTDGTGTWRGADWDGGDAAAIGGIDAIHNDDGSYLLSVALQASAGATLGVCGYGASGWSALTPIVADDAGAGFAIGEPHLARYDGRYHLACAFVDDGSASGLPATRCVLLHSSDGAHWSDPLEDAGTYAHGAVPLKHARGYLLVAPDSAALAPLYTGGATQYRDLSADLSRLDVVERDGTPARLEATLQNGRAWAACTPPLRIGATLRLSFDYANVGSIVAYTLYVEGWDLARAADRDELVIRASDLSARLDRQSRTLLTYRGQTVGWLAREIAARAGLLDARLPATAQFSYTVPAFSVPAGTTWRAALTRLSHLYGFAAGARTAPDASDLLAIAEKSPLDAPVWDYGDDTEGSVATTDTQPANHVLVFGAPASGDPATGEAWDWSAVAATGQERVAHVVDRLIATAAGAALRATLELQGAARRGRGGSLSAALHPAIEPWDVVLVGSGDQSVALRVAGLRHRYEPGRGLCETALSCEGI